MPLLGPHPSRPLAGVEDVARELVRSLDDVQRAAALVSSVAPVDLVSTRISTAPPHRYTGITDAAVKTLRAVGVRGLYKGVFTNLLRSLLSWGVVNSVYGATRPLVVES